MFRTDRLFFESVCDRAHELSIELWACAYILGCARESAKTARPYEFGNRLEMQIRGAAAELILYKQLCLCGYEKTIGEYYRTIAFEKDAQNLPPSPDFVCVENGERRWFDLKTSRCSQSHRYVLGSIRRMEGSGFFSVGFLEVGSALAYFSRLIDVERSRNNGAISLLEQGWSLSDLDGRLGRPDYNIPKQIFVDRYTSLDKEALRFISSVQYPKEEIRKRARERDLRQYMHETFNVGAYNEPANCF